MLGLSSDRSVLSLSLHNYCKKMTPEHHTHCLSLNVSKPFRMHAVCVTRLPLKDVEPTYFIQKQKTGYPHTEMIS